MTKRCAPDRSRRATASVTVSKISRRRRPEDCLRECGHGMSRFRHSDKQRRFSRSHNRPSTKSRRDCIAPCRSWRCMARSRSSGMAVPAVLLHPEDRIDPETLLDRQALVGRQALVDRQARVVLMAPSALEVPVVRDHLSDRVRLARKPRGPIAIKMMSDLAKRFILSSFFCCLLTSGLRLRQQRRQSIN